MEKIILPPEYNYIAAFLTLRCNLNCSYCINKYDKLVVPEEMSGADWIKGLSRIETRKDLPITLSGGEPTIHPGFYEIAEEMYLHMKPIDLLTNGTFELRNFCIQISPSAFMRGAKYASMRFSYHAGMNPTALVMKVWELQNSGYEVGIWCLNNNPRLKYMKKLCAGLNIDFREKEYLSEDVGTYKYPKHMTGEIDRCLCKPSELLIAPDGKIYRCHRDLYAGVGAYAHILDDEVKLPEGFLLCEKPRCNPCDTKIKTNRHQVYGWTSVEIKDING